MAITVGQADEGEQEVMAAINTTPLVDVMLVLLIIFIITIPIQTHQVKINMPDGNPPPPPTPPEVVLMEIDFDGTLLWNGDQIDRATLDQRLAGAAAMPVQPEFHLRPNKLVTYKHVAHVMAAAQRLGVTKIGLIGAEQFLD